MPFTFVHGEGAINLLPTLAGVVGPRANGGACSTRSSIHCSRSAAWSRREGMSKTLCKSATCRGRGRAGAAGHAWSTHAATRGAPSKPGHPRPVPRWQNGGKAVITKGGRTLAVDETVILLQPPLDLIGVSIVMERGHRQNDSLVNG